MIDWINCWLTDVAKPDVAKPDVAKPDVAKPDISKPWLLSFPLLHNSFYYFKVYSMYIKCVINVTLMYIQWTFNVLQHSHCLP